MVKSRITGAGNRYKMCHENPTLYVFLVGSGATTGVIIKLNNKKC